jgi:hypothetical protein
VTFTKSSNGEYSFGFKFNGTVDFVNGEPQWLTKDVDLGEGAFVEYNLEQDIKSQLEMSGLLADLTDEQKTSLAEAVTNNLKQKLVLDAKAPGASAQVSIEETVAVSGTAGFVVTPDASVRVTKNSVRVTLNKSVKKVKQAATRKAEVKVKIKQQVTILNIRSNSEHNKCESCNEKDN